MSGAESLALGVLANLLAQPLVKLLDAGVIKRLEEARDNRALRRTFGEALTAGIREARRRHRGAGGLFADERFLKEQAVVELHKFFTPNERPDPAQLAELCRSYFGLVPPNMEAVAGCFVDAVEAALLGDRQFADLIHGRQIGEIHETTKGTRAEVRELRREVIDALKDAQLERTRHGLDLTDQLPADLADFQGRETEIARLEEALRNGSGQAAISAIAGMGGVGKSALAIHVGHRLANAFPDGRLLVELAGTSPEPLTPVAAMGSVIQAILPWERVPDDPEAVARLYRGVLSGRRVLVLLDNARDTEQVRPLLKWLARGCGAIVTSRRAIAVNGPRLNLGGLDPAEARALLCGLLAAERADAAGLDRLAQRCGYLPLALRVAGTFLERDKSWTLAEYLDVLADERRRLQRLRVPDDPELDVAAVLGVSAVQLRRERPELAERWATLAVFPSGFDRPAAAAVWGVSDDDAREGLSALVARSMVLLDREGDLDRESGRHRYGLHDLMRDVAQGSWEADEPEGVREARRRLLAQATARHAAHYQAVLAAADDLYLEGGEKVIGGLALFDEERRNIETGHVWALANAPQDEEAARLVASYPNAGVYVLGLRLHPRERIRWLEAAVGACRRLGDRAGEGNALGNLGLAYADLGEPRRAVEFHEQHLAIARAIGDRRGEGSALNNLGLAYYSLGEPRRAIELYDQRLAIARAIGDRQREARALFNSGLALDELGDRVQAIARLRAALEIEEAIEDPTVGQTRAKLAEWGVEGFG